MHFSFQTVTVVQPASSFVRIPQEIYTLKCTLPAKKQYKKAIVLNFNLPKVAYSLPTQTFFRSSLL